MNILEKVDHLTSTKSNIFQLELNARQFAESLGQHADELQAVANGSATGEGAVRLIREAISPLQDMERIMVDAQQSIENYIQRIKS